MPVSFAPPLPRTGPGPADATGRELEPYLRLPLRRGARDRIKHMRLGSRGSALARWQAHEIQRRLGERGHACTIEIVQTTGDRRTDVVLGAIGGKGLFTKEIEDGLLNGELDLAVHSLKDVPAELPEGLVLAAFPEREDARDALVAAPGMTWMRLPAGARVGTSSLRRQAQGLALRPDVNIVPLRGNVDTRLRRWRAGDFDALLLAAAGLKRLGLSALVAEWLEPEQFCPAVGQGVLAIETRADDPVTQSVAQELHDASTACAVAAERALLKRLGCGCQAPVAGYARLIDNRLRLEAVVASPDGARLVRRAEEAAPGEAAELGLRLAETLLAAGADEILRAIYADSEPR